MAYKIAIYTAVFGKKDKVREPQNYVANTNVDYFLISDDETLESDCYKIVFKSPVYDDVTKNARYYKIFGLEEFKNYDFVIWHDANLQVIHNELLKAVELAKMNPIAFFKHSERDCVYDEAIKCIQLEKDYPFKILKQLLGYYFIGLKPQSGLYDTSVVVKNNTLISQKFLSFWWQEIKQKSRRDQLSLPYVLKKLSVKPAILEGYRSNNNYTLFSKHSHAQYNFLSSGKSKPFNKWKKAIAIKIIGSLT